MQRSYSRGILLHAVRLCAAAALFAGCGLAPSFILPRGAEKDSDLKAAVEELKAFREWLQTYDAFPVLLVPRGLQENDSTTNDTKDTKEFF